MNSRLSGFNPYLMLGWVGALALWLTAGCSSPEQKRIEKVLYTELQLHPGFRNVSPSATNAVLARIAGVDIPMQTEAFLTEQHLTEAKLVPSTGGYALRLTFDKHGQLVLNVKSVENRGNRIGVFVRYGVRKDKKTPLKVQWIGAPKITAPISQGVLEFTPNATPEEMDQIMEGLNNAIIENNRPFVF